MFGVRSEVLFGEQIKDITEPSEIAMANTGAHTATRNNPHIRSRGLLKNCSKRPIRSIENFEIRFLCEANAQLLSQILPSRAGSRAK